MFKKIISLALAIMMIMGVALIAASAAQVEVVEDAADTPAEVGADTPAEVGAEGEADTGAGSSTIYFDASTTGWANYDLIMVYVYCPSDGSVIIDWASRKAGGMTKGENDIWSYDFDAKGKSLAAGTQYSVIFNTDTGAQTHDLLMDTTCYGDTAYCEAGNEVENPADSNKTSVICRWRGNSALGPLKSITSIGNVVGEVIPAHTTAYQMFVDFLTNTLDNARQYANKSDQDILDDTAEALGLTKADVEKAIKDSGKSGIEWDKSKSKLKDGESGGGSDPTEGSGGSGGTSGTSGGSSKTGSGSGSKTGQETTVLFIMLGVMVAAAGVIFFVRKKDRT